MIPTGTSTSALHLLSAGAGASALAQLEAVQRELDYVRDELEVLRQRDKVLQFSMRRLDEELRLAARLQQDFLPRSLPRVGPLSFHTLFRPAGHVSGDLYDVMRLDESHVAFYLADAVGHGMPAALLSMFLKTALVTKDIRPEGYRLLRPAQTMQKLNDALVEQNLSQATFATALYGTINTRTLRLTFTRAGHPSPMLLKSNGTLQSLECEGSLLGIFAGEQYEECVVQLDPGDRLFLYSDGLELAFNDEPTLDSHHWREQLACRRDLPTEQILGDFARHIDSSAPDSPVRKDDLTMVVADVDRVLPQSI